MKEKKEKTLTETSARRKNCFDQSVSVILLAFFSIGRLRGKKSKIGTVSSFTIRFLLLPEKDCNSQMNSVSTALFNTFMQFT